MITTHQSVERRRRMTVLATSLLIVTLGVATAPAAFAEMGGKSEPISEEIRVGALDLLVLRPLGFTRLVIGAGLFVPISALNGLGQASLAALGAMGVGEGGELQTLKEAADLMVVQPFEYFATRPLGKDLAG